MRRHRRSLFPRPQRHARLLQNAGSYGCGHGRRLVQHSDLGFLDPDGWLYLTGRKKNVIVTKNGENIYPEEIEIIVNNHPFISDCMVYAAQKDGSDIVAVQIIPNMENIMSKLGKEPTPEELQKLMKNIIGDINETMSSYKRIRSIVIRKEDFVRTTTKKNHPKR